MHRYCVTFYSDKTLIMTVNFYYAQLDHHHWYPRQWRDLGLTVLFLKKVYIFGFCRVIWVDASAGGELLCASQFIRGLIPLSCWFWLGWMLFSPRNKPSFFSFFDPGSPSAWQRCCPKRRSSYTRPAQSRWHQMVRQSYQPPVLVSQSVGDAGPR